MLAFVFAINSLLVCAVTSMVQCRDADSGVTYISEFILLCKRGAHTWVLPWLCVAAFEALLLVQLGWMYGVVSAWCASRVNSTSWEVTCIARSHVPCLAG